MPMPNTPPSPSSIPTTATATATTTTTTANREIRPLYCLLTASLLSFLLLISLSSSTTSLPTPSSPTPTKHHQKFIINKPFQSPLSPLSPTPPSIAYFLSASDGDSARLLRLLFSIYHPRNQYLLHLDLTASQSQRDDLAISIQSVPVFRAMQNVNVIGKADFAYPRGSSPISSTLHGAAIHLRLSTNWDWFVNLDASHYPLVTQDDLLHILSYLPKDLNFMNHTCHIGWRESRRMKLITVDPGLYLSAKTDMFYATQKRELPNAYRLFEGAASAIMSRKFVEFCILGTDNLPRTVLMYLSNTPASQANYFQTVVCNAREFNKTVVNHNLQYSSWTVPQKREQHILGLNDYDKMLQSGAAFGWRFVADDPVLDHIDREILNREPGKVGPGGWCLGEVDDEDRCSVWGEIDILRPGPGARRLERHIVGLLSNETFHTKQCIFE